MFNRDRNEEEDRTLSILNEILLEEEYLAKDFNAEYERIK